MSKPSRTIRWDDPAYSTKSSEDSSSVTGSLNNSNFLPAGNLAIKQTGNTSVSTAVTSTSWRELKTRDGRAYYYNSVTQQTLWEMPQEYREYLDFIQKGGSSRRSSAGDSGDTEFWEILKERRVTSKWTWEETLRAIITHPNYKCIPTLQERKASFQRYCETMRKIEEEEARLQSLAVKEAFKSLLASDPQLTSDTKWSEVVDKHGKNEDFLAVPSSRDRVQLFEEYQSELRRTELEGVWERRKAAFAQITEILKEMNLSLDLERGKVPDWFTIKDKLTGILPDVDSIEYLLAFEEHVQELLKEFQASRRAERQAELLKELEYRDAFNSMLWEIEAKEHLTPFSTWSSVYPLFKDRPEYCNITSIYLYGSSPIDLFYDILDRVQGAYEQDRSRIIEYFKKEFMTIEPARLPKKFSSFTQFKDTFKEALYLEGPHVKYFYTELYGPEAVSDDRNRINAYKHLLKHLSPSIKISDTWEDVRKRLHGREEYEAVQCEEDRELYFLKFKKWLSKHVEEQKSSEPPIVRNEGKRSRWDKRDSDNYDEHSERSRRYNDRRDYDYDRDRW